MPSDLASEEFQSVSMSFGKDFRGIRRGGRLGNFQEALGSFRRVSGCFRSFKWYVSGSFRRVLRWFPGAQGCFQGDIREVLEGLQMFQDVLEDSRDFRRLPREVKGVSRRLGCVKWFQGVSVKFQGVSEVFKWWLSRVFKWCFEALKGVVRA